MRCVACNRILTDREATRKSALTGEYLDLCDADYLPIAEDVPVIESDYEDEGEVTEEEE